MLCVCRKGLPSPRCISELIDSAWVVIVPGQKCIKKQKTNKQCFNKKIKPTIANENVNDSDNFGNKNGSVDYNPTNDRSMIDLIRESMIKERPWNDDTQTILLNQVLSRR